ncbi:MAG: sensor domain-containing diguanylate cyclase [Spirochaetaceae bacterium]
MDTTKQNRLFANIGKLITSSLDSTSILERIMSEVQLYFNPLHWSLFKFDRTSNLLYFAIFEGADVEQVKHVKLKPGEGIAGTVVSSGKSIFVKDAAKDSRFSNKVDLLTGFQTESIIAVPIKINNEVYGVIEIINHENHDLFSDEDHFILQSIADFAAIAFKNNSRYVEAIKRSEIDALTGLFNKSKLTDLIEHHTKKEYPTRRDHDNDAEIIIVFIDLDEFKSINDTYGHSEGDEVLMNLAMRLRSVFRSDDLIFRVGGDEFLVYIEIEDANEADLIINRISNLLSTLTISSLTKEYSVSLSFGIKSGQVRNIDKIIDDADLKMYDSKRGHDKI